MTRYWIILGVFAWAMPAWAAHQMTPGTRFDLGELTSEFKRAVPALEGCDDTLGTITCRRLTGDFTDAEKALMDTTLSTHDPNIAQKRTVQKSQKRNALITKLCQGAGLTGQDLQDCKDELGR